MLWRLLWFCFVFFFLSSRTVVVLFCFPRCMPVFSHFLHFPRHCFFYSRIAPHRRSKGNIVRRMCGGRFASIDVVSTAFSVTGAVAVTASEAGQIHREWEGLVLPLRRWQRHQHKHQSVVSISFRERSQATTPHRQWLRGFVGEPPHPELNNCSCILQN